MVAGASLQLARHVVETPWEALPPETARAARRSLLDAIGVTLAAGTLEPACRPFVESAIADGGRPESSILGFEARVPAAAAAFANGSLAHALDFEDAHDEARVHPYAATVAAALAVAQSRSEVTTNDVIAALVVGSDVVCRLGLALLEDPVKRGWYMAPILGAFGAAAAAGRLLGLSAEQMVDAFSLTLSQATCSAESAADPDSLIRAVRDAFAARAGVVSAQLAARGTRGFKAPFEGRAGLFGLYAPEEHDLEALTEGLGTRFEGARVSYKPWPSCRGTHAHIEATLGLVIDDNLESHEIRTVRVGVPDIPVMRMLCEPIDTKRSPRSAIDAKFSLPFVVSVAAALHRVDLDAFTEHGLGDERVVAASDILEHEFIDSQDPHRGWVEIGSDLGVRRADVPPDVLGSPGNPMSDADLEAKFTRCAEYSPNPPSSTDVERVIMSVMDADTRSSPDDWISLLCPATATREEDHAAA
jgi:2-methylcitrate dehydratase PrpD